MPIDYKKYPPNWKTEIVPRILDRADNHCECCGLKNHTIVYAVKYYMRHNGHYGFRTIWFRNHDDAGRECLGRPIEMKKVVLTIAHLDHDEENWDVADDRLAAWCQICHLRYDAPEKMRRVISKAMQMSLVYKTA